MDSKQATQSYRKLRRGKIGDLTEDELISYAQTWFPGKRILIVRDWMTIGVLLPNPELMELEATGSQALMLYAQFVTHDSENLISPRESIITGYVCAREVRVLESGSVGVILTGGGFHKDIFLSRQ